jgi:hypothetical protein
MYARLKPDILQAKWLYMSRTNPRNPRHVKLIQAPQTIRFSGGRGLIRLRASGVNLIRRLNTLRAYSYLTRKASGWVNQSPWPRVEQLSFANNVVEITHIVGNRCYIDYLDNRRNVSGVNYYNNPTLVHQFTVVDQEGRTLLPPKGLTYMIVVAESPLWIDINELELFPEFGTYEVLVPHLSVRDSPNGSWLRTIQEETPVTISEYSVKGSEVWGKIGDCEWIALYHPSVIDKYTTTWVMETPPPPMW